MQSVVPILLEVSRQKAASDVPLGRVRLLYRCPEPV